MTTLYDAGKSLHTYNMKQEVRSLQMAFLNYRGMPFIQMIDNHMTCIVENGLMFSKKLYEKKYDFSKR